MAAILEFCFGHDAMQLSRDIREEEEERRNFYLKSNKMVNTTLANSLLRRLDTQYVQHNIQYLQQIYK